MKSVRLTQGLTSYVDDDIFEIVSQYRWHAKKAGSGCTWYAECAKWNHKFKVRRMKLHHVVVGTPINGLVPDHIDGNGLNNLRENLRLVTVRENNSNIRLKHRKTSQFIGVCWHKASKKWKAAAGVGGKKLILGYFTVEQDAADAYQSAIGGKA